LIGWWVWWLGGVFTINKHSHTTNTHHTQGAQNGSMNAADGGAMKVAMCCKHLAVYNTEEAGIVVACC
jgi:hypothetical protein